MNFAQGTCIFWSYVIGFAHAPLTAKQVRAWGLRFSGGGGGGGAETASGLFPRGHASSSCVQAPTTAKQVGV